LIFIRAKTIKIYYNPVPRPDYKSFIGPIKILI
jgi:hypothetical protein